MSDKEQPSVSHRYLSQLKLLTQGGACSQGHICRRASSCKPSPAASHEQESRGKSCLAANRQRIGGRLTWNCSSGFGVLLQHIAMSAESLGKPVACRMDSEAVNGCIAQLPLNSEGLAISNSFGHMCCRGCKRCYYNQMPSVTHPCPAKQYQQSR